MPLPRLVCGTPDTLWWAGIGTAPGGELFGVLSCEVGGANGLEPLALGARLALPVIDADLLYTPLKRGPVSDI